jgi:hypothetical protein
MEAVFHHKVSNISGKKLLPLIILSFIFLSFKAFSQNDACGSAPTITLTAGTYTTAGNNTGFIVNAGEPTTRPCGSGVGSIKCVGWYILTTDAQGGNLAASLTFGGMTYGALTLYSFPGSCSSFSTNPAPIACSDPNTGAGTPTFTATCLAPNTNYYLMVWTDGSHAGTFTLNTTYTPSGSDACANAASLAAGTTIGANDCATYTPATDHTVSCQSNTAKYGYTVWYKYTTGATGGNLTISLASGTINYAALALYSGNCAGFSELDCMDQYSIVSASPSVSASCLSANTDYYLMVFCDGAANSGYGGTYTLTTTFNAISNDCCNGATAITMNSGATIDSYSGTVTGNNSTATADGSVYCFTPNKNQYYSFTAPVAGSYYCGIVPGTMTDPEIAVYTGSCGALTLSNCAGDDGTNIKDANHATVYTSSGTYTMAYSPFSLYSSNYTYGGVCNLAANQTAYIMVDNYPGGTSGTYTLTVANISNDDITNPLLITSCGSIFNGTTVGATNCGNALGNGLQNDVDNNTVTACTNNAAVTSCGTAGVAGNGCYGNNGGAGNQYDADKNGGDIGYSIENDSWYEFCVVSNCTVTITFSVSSASCLVPNGGTAALQLSAFTGSAANLTKIYGGYCLESIATSVSFSFAATAGTCYFFEVDGYSGANCPYTLQATMVPLCVLPVKLLYFTGTNEEGKTKLEWATAEEENSDKYVVERSDDGVNYIPIGTVKAKGNSSAKTEYVIYDDHPLINKVNYYKLDGFDRNGTGGVLAQTFVNNTANFPKFNVYPNPSTGKFTISLHNFSVSNVLVEIFDVYGKSVWSSNIELNEGKSIQEVDFLNFDEGIYIIRTSDGDTFYNQRLIISR